MRRRIQVGRRKKKKQSTRPKEGRKVLRPTGKNNPRLNSDNLIQQTGRLISVENSVNIKALSIAP